MELLSGESSLYVVNAASARTLGICKTNLGALPPSLAPPLSTSHVGMCIPHTLQYRNKNGTPPAPSAPGGSVQKLATEPAVLCNTQACKNFPSFSNTFLLYLLSQPLQQTVRPPLPLRMHPESNSEVRSPLRPDHPPTSSSSSTPE